MVLYLFYFRFKALKRQIRMKDRIIVAARPRSTSEDVQFRGFVFIVYVLVLECLKFSSINTHLKDHFHPLLRVARSHNT